jgi:cytochrome c553
LYYIDVWGNKELIHRDPVLSVAYPLLYKKQKTPPKLTGAGENSKSYATVYMTDIYQGVPEFRKGEVKYVRIAHHTESPAFERTGDKVIDYNHYHYPPFGSWMPSVGNWTWSPTRVIGTVPVEEDGSLNFKVPADIPVYFQALDEHYQELRRMRTFIAFQPGEVRGCTGCHESRDEAPYTATYADHKIPTAVQREPSTPEPPTWGATVLPDFERDIQPIFTKNCASCHGSESPKAGLDFSARRIDGLNQAYRTLFGLSPKEPTPIFSFRPEIYQKMYPEYDYTYRNGQQDREKIRKMAVNDYPGQLVSISNKESDNSVTQVREFGSTQSRVIMVIKNDRHQERVNLSQEEWRSLVTWIDLNAPYWGSFWDKEPMRYGNKPQRVYVKYPEPFESPDYRGTVIVKKTADY